MPGGGGGDPMLHVVLIAMATADTPSTSSSRALALRAQARTALGGESALASVHSLSLEGHFRRRPPSLPSRDAFATVLTREQIANLPDDPDEMEQVLQDMAGPDAVIRVNGSAQPSRRLELGVNLSF
jgi:hypothetical protein